MEKVTIAVIDQFGDTLMEILEGPIESVTIALCDWDINATFGEIAKLAESGGGISSDDLEGQYCAIRYADYSN